jgi:lipoate-protein ligase A
MVFQRISLWLDPVKRPGPEAMAVDEWLLETAEHPVLRVYGWLGNWGSLGYFGRLNEARASFHGAINWVRRWTGGGAVDHRADWTYTVVSPFAEPLTRLKGAESYRLLHDALAEALRMEAIDTRLSTGSEETGATLCFENPVNHDLMDSQHRKLAGAGQRRTKHGLLHQGSVAAPCDASVSETRAKRLASILSENWRLVSLEPPREALLDRVAKRYAASSWTTRR